MEKVTELAEILAPYNYVVQRNWIQDPEHPDWDLFVSEDDFYALRNAVQDIPDIDIRRPSDRYYPDYINDRLLDNKRITEDGFNIPNPEAYFLALYYHAVVHKEVNKYHDELKRAFLEWIPPVKCVEEGVGYYVNP